MNRILILFIAACTMASHAIADNRLQRINDIKKDHAYLYAEATMKTQAEAATVAYELLQKEIFSWASDRADKTIRPISITELNSLVDTIVTRRADMYRVFASVEKFKLVKLFDDADIVMIDSLDTGFQASPVSPSDAVSHHNIVQSIKRALLGKRNGILERLKQARTFFELKEILQPLKEEGKVTGFGKYATAKHPEECYLIVYDAAGNIKALLDRGADVRRNLKTNQDDHIDNYRGCGAIWFTLKE